MEARGGPQQESATAGVRALAAAVAIVLGVAAAVMVAVAVDIGGTPTLEECTSNPDVIPDDGECFDGSEAAKTASVVLAYGAGALGALAAIVGLFFAATARNGQLFVQLAVGSMVVAGISVLVGSL